jgi:hypothetical protein
MVTKTMIVLFITLGLASVHLAEAQQPKKVFRIGFLGASSPSTIRPASRQSARVFASLGTWRGKTSLLSIDMRREN